MNEYIHTFHVQSTSIWPVLPVEIPEFGGLSISFHWLRVVLLAKRHAILYPSAPLFWFTQKMSGDIFVYVFRNQNAISLWSLKEAVGFD